NEISHGCTRIHTDKHEVRNPCASVPIRGQCRGGRGAALVTRRGLLAIGGAVAGAAGALTIGTRMVRTARPVFHRLTFRRGTVFNARFAPDGAIVYDASWEAAPPRI